MNYTFRLTNTSSGQLFESKRQVPVRVEKHTEGDLYLSGILHSVYAKAPFVLYNYLGNHITSKKIDGNNFMIHFPSGVPITPEMGTALYPLDQVGYTTFDVHYELCVLDLTIPTNLCVHGSHGILSL